MVRKLSQVLIDLDPARLGEINLLLSALAGGHKSEDVVRRAVLSISGRSDRIPQPDLYLEVALGLGLIAGNPEGLVLTALGSAVQAASSGPAFDRMTADQSRLIAPEIVEHPELQDAIVQALEVMFPTSALRLQIGSRDVPAASFAALGLKLLQAVGLVRYDDDLLVIADDSLRELWNLLGQAAPLSEDDLSVIQQGIEKRAKEAEEYVAQFERNRLIQAGRKELANMVTRVSKFDIGAHYDIRSFEENALPRYIEVKSSSSLHLNFVWTLAERNFARSKGEAYWLYFVPRAQDLPRLRHGLVLVSDPDKRCGTTLIPEPLSFRVWLHDGRTLSTTKIADETVRILE